MQIRFIRTLKWKKNFTGSAQMNFEKNIDFNSLSLAKYKATLFLLENSS